MESTGEFNNAMSLLENLSLILSILKSGRYVVSGQSMEPALSHNQIVFVNKNTYEVASPQRGDIIVVTPPATPNLEAVKRIVGLPKENIKLSNKGVCVNGKAITANWSLHYTNKINHCFEWTTQENEYVVLGDNVALLSPDMSSKMIGLVKKSQIIGKVSFRLWPMHKL